MMFRVDLHTHTTASDGVLSPAALVGCARAAGVGLLAITDHDTADGLEAAWEAARGGVPRILPGVELSASWGTRTVHVVGLGIDPAEPGLRAWLAALRAAREERAERVAARLARIGEADILAEVRTLAGSAVLTRTHFARVLVARGRVPDVRRALRRYLGRGRSAYVPWRWPAMAETVAVIRRAGGQAVLAHPLRYRLSRALLGELLREFRDAGGVAVEIAPGPSGGPGLDDLVSAVRAAGLAGSLGSDFHEPGAGPVLGGVGRLPAGVPPVWEDAAAVSAIV